MHFEEGVNEEWFLQVWTNIQKGSGYPVGSGAAIHAPAAVHISNGVDDKEWPSAVGGRLLGLKLFRLEMLQVEGGSHLSET